MDYYLAIDPGEKRVGWASFKEDGTETGMGTIIGDPDTFMDWLESLDPAPKEIIYENYRVNPTINHGFSKVVTIQLIGMIKRYAKHREIVLHEQDNTRLPIGLRYIGMFGMYYDVRTKKRTKHVDDQISAYAHGVYYLQTQGIRKSRVEGR
jgi:hypothetical protein